jgi:hypothetical protein
LALLDLELVTGEWMILDFTALPLTWQPSNHAQIAIINFWLQIPLTNIL